MDIHPHHAAAALHVAGFLCGLALYGMLFALAARERITRGSGMAAAVTTDVLPILTGIFGVIWNAGAMVVHGLADLGLGAPPPIVAVATYAALGFLPAVVAHSTVRPTWSLRAGRPGRWLVILAYGLSGCAAALQVLAAASGGRLPSGGAFRLLTAGYVGITIPLVIAARRQALWRRALVVLALGVFGVSATHLVDHQDFTSPVWVQVLGHHASLPLAVAILLQDYPFAFGDILLKRMLALGALVALTLAGVFGLVRSPILADVGADLDRPEFVGSLLTLVAGLALVYPWVRAKAAAFVDSVVLKRADPTVVLASLTRLASEREDVNTLITEAGAVLTTALSSPPARWDAGLGVANGEGPSCALASVAEGEASRHIVPVSLESDGRCARVILPTSDPPHPAAVIGPLAGGRRLLVADVALLQNASTVLARRIDAIRIEHERVERRWREQEMARLAVDAELRALRAQLNPHFLFNALTTIGYLVKTAPDQAVHTLLRLTEVLRRALRQDEAIVTLASELQMVEAYLDIERARFEERLRVTVDVPDEVKHIRIPAFVLQPLVENAVKHGVAPSRTGGLVSVRARVRTAAVPVLELTVSDTGRGRDGSAGGHDGQGIGLANVRRRLELAYGADASIRFAADPDGGAEVTVTIPCPDFRAGRDPGRQERPTEGPLS